MANSYKSLVDEYKQKFSKANITISDTQIASLIDTAVSNAKQTYAKLHQPSLMNQGLYISHWIREKLNELYVIQTMTKASASSSDPLVVSLLKFISDKNEQNFIQLTIARNDNSKRLGFSSFVEQILYSHKIPPGEFSKFHDRINGVIEYCNQNPLSEINPHTSINFPDEVLDYVNHSYSDHHVSRIHITIGESSSMRYLKENDLFEVTISQKLNLRRKAIDLFHELGHVIAQTREFQENRDPLEVGKYQEEKGAVRIQLDLLKKYSSKLYQEYLEDVLWLIVRARFELALYEKPNQELSDLYSMIFKECLKGRILTNESSYLSDQLVTHRPLSSLPQTVALVNTISDNIVT